MLHDAWDHDLKSISFLPRYSVMQRGVAVSIYCGQVVYVSFLCKIVVSHCNSWWHLCLSWRVGDNFKEAVGLGIDLCRKRVEENAQQRRWRVVSWSSLTQIAMSNATQSNTTATKTVSRTLRNNDVIIFEIDTDISDCLHYIRVLS